MRCIDEDKETWDRAVAMMFRTLDCDGSGDIDVSELASGLLMLGVQLRPDEVVAIQREFDADGNGGITLVEFKSAVNAKWESRPKAQVVTNTLDDAWNRILEVARADPIK